MGRILVPNKSLIVPKEGQAICQMPRVEMAGFYRCQVRKAKSGSLKTDTGWFPNVITNTGLGYFHTQPHFGSFDTTGATFNQLAVGTGTGTPAVTDGSLFSYLTSVSSGTTGGGSGWQNQTGAGYVAAASPNPAYWWVQNSYTFPTGQAAGNLTEIGCFPGGTSYNGGLFSHALIVDANGNPTTITVLSDEVLTAQYQVNFYINPNDTSFSFNLNGSPVTGIYRMWNVVTTPTLNGGLDGLVPSVDVYTGAIGPYTGNPSGTSAVLSNANNNPGSFTDWVNDISNSGTWYYDYTFTTPAGVATGTWETITYSHGIFQYQFGNLSTPITKTSGQQLQMSFRGAWGRH